MLVNDIHSGLNATEVEGIVPITSPVHVQAALDRAHAAGRAVSVAGGRHAMGGQQYATGSTLLDMRPMNRVLSFAIRTGAWSRRRPEFCGRS